jgi:hypothetical protein
MPRRARTRAPVIERSLSGEHAQLRNAKIDPHLQMLGAQRRLNRRLGVGVAHALPAGGSRNHTVSPSATAFAANSRSALAASGWMSCITRRAVLVCNSISIDAAALGRVLIKSQIESAFGGKPENI